MCAYYARYGVEIKSFVLSCLVTQLTLEFLHRVYCKSLFIQLAPRIHHPPTEKSIPPCSRVGEGAQLKPTSRSQFVSYSLYPNCLVLFSKLIWNNCVPILLPFQSKSYMLHLSSEKLPFIPMPVYCLLFRAGLTILQMFQL